MIEFNNGRNSYTENDENCRRDGVVDNLTVVWRPSQGFLCEVPMRISACTLYFQKLELLIYILPLIVWVYLHSNFSGGLRKRIFSARVGIGRSRSSNVIDFLKPIEVCDFLLVLYSNLTVLSCTVSEIFRFLCSWPHPYFTLVLGCSRWRTCWGQPEQKP